MSTTRYFSLARHALVEALHAIDIQPGDSVAIPGLICRELLASLATVGAHPVFYQVDERLRPIAFSSDDGICAIVAVNYFGFAQDLAPFNQFCSDTGAVLIEDNAHGFLSSDETGKLLGTRGVMGITSVRKTIRIADGAILSVNAPHLFDRIHDQLPSTTYSTHVFRCRKLVATVERRFHIPVLRLMRALSRTLRRIRTGSSLPTVTGASETEILHLLGPHKSSLLTLQQLDSNSEIARRRKLYAQVHRELTGLGVTPLFPDLSRGTVPYGYPFFCDESALRVANQKVAKYGVEIIRWPDLPDAIAESAPFHYTNLWLVNFL
ncbi:MAG: DegT/DnrJ/EryC1/StrS family aminotransferase [Ilumatobacteraceae bacterium]